MHVEADTARSGSRLGAHRSVLAVAVHLAFRAATMLAIVVAAAVHTSPGRSLGARVGAALSKSDGVWYLGIAHHGYGSPPPLGPNGVYTHLTSLAFFPLYPLLIRAVADSGLPYLGAALLVSLLAGTAAAAILAAWGRRVVGDAGALALVAVWNLLPSSVVLGMAYSEALFVAAAAGCLLALQRERWVVAAVAASLGGLTRPTGCALVLAVWLAALVAVRRRGLAPGHVAAAVLAPVGFVVSLVHVAVATHRWDGWFWLERTDWRSGFDGGWSALLDFRQLVTDGLAAHRLPEVVACGVIVGALVLVVLLLRGRPWPTWPDAGYSLTAAVLAVGERGYFYVKPRLLFVAFPILTPVARAAARWPARRLVAVGAPVVLASLAYNAYLVVVWPKAL